MIMNRVVLAALVAAVSAAPACKPSPISINYTLPALASSLVEPPSNMTLKKIALGHGIQNYTCASDNTTVAAVGALAVLYDVTALYPGTPTTGLSQSDWDALSTTILWNQDIPLNLINESGASPGTRSAPNALPETMYAADTAAPFLAPSDLTFASDVETNLPTLKFLGHHFFDSASVPNFDLSAAGLYGVVSKKSSVNAPAGADAGIIDTGAVAWLRLADSGSSKGVSWVYRVNTAGGTAEACTTSGAGAGSVPYSALYWFYAQGS